jgi:hypothetical protein
MVGERHLQVASPTANPHNLIVLAATPNQDRIPPCLFGLLAGIAGLKSRGRIGGLNGRLNVRYTREGFLCLDPAGA